MQCFFEFSSHFIDHKSGIHEINDVIMKSSAKNPFISEVKEGVN